MHNKTTKYQVFLLFIVIWTSSLHAQKYLDDQMLKAAELHASGSFYDAVTEAKRLIYFDREKKYFIKANLLIAHSYKKGARLNDAIRHFTLAANHLKNDSLWFDVQTEIIRCNILRQTAGQAAIILDKLSADKRFAPREKELIYWRGWNYIFSDQWDRAAAEFAKKDEFRALRVLCEDVQNEKYSVSFAKVISYILPGFGQFYTGNYLSGFMSLAWTGLWGYLAYNAFIADRVFDGAVLTGLFVRFHRGNAQNAEEFAVQKNREITDKTLNYLQYQYEGLKP